MRRALSSEVRVREPVDEPVARKRWGVTGGEASGHLERLQRTLVVLEGFVSLCGLAGGAFMFSHPFTMMPLRYLEGTWFQTWRWPGVALFFFVGVAPAMVVVATFTAKRFSLLGHFAIGVGLVAWIVLEAVWVVISAPLQLTFGGIGVAIIALAQDERRTLRKEQRV
ncbi:MAG: hypothetical protein HKL86_01625 [Acidimicrobiaceae bacterium]|nr:hypothetical protein [Acidimicrobiaceae bacterium]